jgi:choline dehydrogenase-like flavoprotein
MKTYKTKAVVVGTGAGGAVAGTTLAQAGVDTIILEEGKYFKPGDYGTVYDGFANMYQGGGSTIAFGRPPISITLGRCVGGTTAINSSTCFRPPEKKVAAWGGPSYDELVPYMQEIETRINATPATPETIGGNWRVLKRGCDKLGVELKPLVHNIKDCKRRGRCQFGCPEGAKRSTEISFIPDAIKAGAQLLAGHRIDSVIIENKRAAGVRGTVLEDGSPFEVRADTTVLSLGALTGPAFLLQHRLCNGSRTLGRGLQIHPACRVVAEFDEVVDGHIGLPQGAFIDKWKDRGVVLEGIFLHPGFLVTMLPGVGHELKDLAVRYPHMSAFGVMVDDTTCGRVLPGHWGTRFTALYQMNQQDARKMQFGIARVAEIYFAAGAKRVFTPKYGHTILNSADEIKGFETARVKSSHYELGAFHPLGTARMGADPKKSVVDFDLKAHDIASLYIMDGSVVPGSLGVNPQVTIMTLALRAARRLAHKIKA